MIICAYGEYKNRVKKIAFMLTHITAVCTNNVLFPHWPTVVVWFKKQKTQRRYRKTFLLIKLNSTSGCSFSESTNVLIISSTVPQLFLMTFTSHVPPYTYAYSSFIQRLIIGPCVAAHQSSSYICTARLRCSHGNQQRATLTPQFYLHKHMRCQ